MAAYDEEGNEPDCKSAYQYRDGPLIHPHRPLGKHAHDASASILSRAEKKSQMETAQVEQWLARWQGEVISRWRL